MGAVLSISTRLVTMSCCSCGIWFALPEDLDKILLAERRSFYCPNGHAQSYAGKTEAQKLQDQLDAKERLLQQERRWREQEHDRRVDTERRLSAAKGQATKLRKRAIAGVCPCCNRSFVALGRHMKTKHPEYAEAEG